MRSRLPYLFLFAGLCALIAGAVFGMLASVQYLSPGFLKGELPFSRLRPMHVSTMVAWILLSASGVVYFRLQALGASPRRTGLAHLVLFALTGFIALGTLAGGVFGGREYMAFSPWIGILVVGAWLFFAVGFIRGVRGKLDKWPVYMWMWATGIGFFLFTFAEAQLWLIPWFRDNLIRELTVQWKSYGALIGSWNMLVYGTAIYVMHEIYEDSSAISGRMPFFLFFVGLTNLMFGWAHHSYVVPAAPWVRDAAYAISMTELVILGLIIRNWRATVQKARIKGDDIACRLLFSSDVWILLNLILALAISVPFINYFTHGTYITVAHAMGTTIGINTTILFAAIFFILERSGRGLPDLKMARKGLLVFNGFLGTFWLSLIAAGVVKSRWMYGEEAVLFRDMLSNARPWFYVFVISGFGLFLGVLAIARPQLQTLWALIRRTGPASASTSGAPTD